MVRELTPGEERRLLTQEQVDALPNGTVVYVKWTGGNGPHMYIIRQHNGKAYALTEREIREGGGFIPASDRTNRSSWFPSRTDPSLSPC